MGRLERLWGILHRWSESLVRAAASALSIPRCGLPAATSVQFQHQHNSKMWSLCGNITVSQPCTQSSSCPKLRCALTDTCGLLLVSEWIGCVCIPARLPACSSAPRARARLRQRRLLNKSCKVSRWGSACSGLPTHAVPHACSAAPCMPCPQGPWEGPPSMGAWTLQFNQECSACDAAKGRPVRQTNSMALGPSSRRGCQ